MKKMILIPALAGVLALSAVAMTGYTVEAATNGLLTMEKARAIAVKSVGGKVTEIELKRKKSGSMYEVEVQSKGFEYDLDINAKTGKILRTDKDDLDDMDDDDVIVFTKKFITPEAAEKIALKKAKGAIVKVALENDDNRVIYEIEMEDGLYEYDFDIDAISGKILEFEKDKKND
ncbi:PepSY domain-containing protein [Solibacillus cecembensis]|uniref:PepSY domain-containing protein n=1 Tax=Solibacillus cecembensis TaxID=459347 RepID=UPI003CFCD348